MTIICFCHLRWNFVYQRPQHLLSRFAQKFKVHIIEEPFLDAEMAFLDIFSGGENITIIVPHLPPGLPKEEIIIQQKNLLKEYYSKIGPEEFIFWYYTPMALPLADALPVAELVVYDCMDELSAFKNAPATIREQEAMLLEKADIVFTGGYSLYEAKKNLHPFVYPFPSSIDKQHFLKARFVREAPIEQKDIPHPRIGFFGVIDERFHIELLDNLAILKPEWQFVIIGPVVKIDPVILPNKVNIHYLGGRSYEDLPNYMAGWDAAMIPFATNDSTRFISPTKTPEYLAGGLPVVSTSIRDVINPYKDEGLVYIADTAEEFIKGIEWGLSNRDNPEWLKKTDNFLANIAWDITWEKMMSIIQNKLNNKIETDKLTKKTNEYV